MRILLGVAVFFAVTVFLAMAVLGCLVGSVPAFFLLGLMRFFLRMAVLARRCAGAAFEKASTNTANNDTNDDNHGSNDVLHEDILERQDFVEKPGNHLAPVRSCRVALVDIRKARIGDFLI